MNSFVLAILLTSVVVACSKASPNGDNVEQVFGTSITKVQFEVDYMTGQAPQVGTAFDGKPIWNFFTNNISALFNDTRDVVAPTTLAEMEEIPAELQDYSSDTILNIAAAHRDHSNFENDSAWFYILFVDGYYDDNGITNELVLGISLGDSGIIAIFKPAIESNTFPNQKIRAFTEQSVLIHEAGHALGLVNNGLPLTSEHQDPEYGAHCSNQECVMYWQNEGAIDLIQFLLKKNPSTETILFASDCLEDAHSVL